MIKIINKGKAKKKEKIIYILKCEVCGCDFECELEDFKTLSKSITNPFATIDCPWCKTTVFCNRNEVDTRVEEVKKK